MSNDSTRPYPPFGLLQFKPYATDNNFLQSPFDGTPAKSITVNAERITLNRLDYYTTDLDPGKRFSIEFTPEPKRNIDQPFRLGDYGTQDKDNTDLFYSADCLIGEELGQRLSVLANQGKKLENQPPEIHYEICIIPKKKKNGPAVRVEFDPDAYVEC